MGGGDDLRFPLRQHLQKGFEAEQARFLLRSPARKAGEGGDIRRKQRERNALPRAQRTHEISVRAGTLPADAVFDVERRERYTVVLRVLLQIKQQRDGISAARQSDAHAPAAEKGQVGIHAEIIPQKPRIGNKKTGGGRNSVQPAGKGRPCPAAQAEQPARHALADALVVRPNARN